MSIINITLEDTLNRVLCLNELPLNSTQPNVESINGTLIYQCDLDTNFQDKTAYVRGISKYIEEAAKHAELNGLLEKGNEHARMLYTWRCCSRAIPQVKSNDQANRMQIYDRTVEVLKTHIEKLRDLMLFKDKSINEFCTEIRRLCHPKKEKEFVSEAYLLTLGKFINMFAVLDELKNMKSSVKNDYSAYKRAAQQIQSESGKESQDLSMFLATNDVIRATLKRALDDPHKGCPGYEEILADIVNASLQMFESRMYLLPQEKHVIIKVIGFSLNLLDSDTTNINKLDSKKRINLSKIDKMFKQYKVVPLYGDMQITPFSYIMKTRNYDESKWPCCTSKDSESSQGKILDCIERIRYEHTLFITEIAKYSNESINKNLSKRNDEDYQHLYNLALNGLKLLSKWTNTVLELYNWKLLHPADQKLCPKESEDYERATKYNYSSQEKYALVEVISMIKGLQTIMFRLEKEFREAIQHTTYAEIQKFVQDKLRDVIRKAISKNKDFTKTILLAVRDTCVDWYRGKEPDDDPALKGKKDKENTFKYERPTRCVAPSSTQLYMVRTMLESLISDRGTSGGKSGKKSLLKDFDETHVELIEKFHRDSFFWQYLLNLNDSLYKCCDLSQMWYREFFLEMTMGRRIQFPIEMSMPWILMSHILETRELSMMEYLFYPLDLYNDAAINALKVFKKRHLYDEVEAEVNLCFDQFVYNISKQIYKAFKKTAACILLDKKFRDEYNKIQANFQAQNSTSSNSSNANLSNPSSPNHPITSNTAAHHTHRINVPNTSRFEVLMKQRNIQLLGRCINFSRLIAQRITIMLLDDLKTIVGKFESSDLTGIMELDTLIRIHRQTHSLLCKNLLLSDFNELLKEADLNVSSSSTTGRIVMHIIYEITADLLPNYCFNSSTRRFILTKFRLNKEPPRDSPPPHVPQDLWGSKAIQTVYQAIHSLYTGFLGTPHLKCINKHLGYQGIAMIIDDFTKLIASIIDGRLADELVKIQKSIKRLNFNLPFYDYGSSAILTLFYEQLETVIKSSEVRSNVFHLFNQIGNAIIFSLLLEQQLSIDEVNDLVHASIFSNGLPKLTKKESEQQQIERKYASIQVVKLLEKFGTETQRKLAGEGELLTRERLCCGLSIFEYVLKEIRETLEKSQLNAQSNEILDSYKFYQSTHTLNSDTNEGCLLEFYRLWSAIQFNYCMPKNGNGSSAEEMFGDGLLFAGCTMLSLLNQQQKFEAFDLTYHLVRMNSIDGKCDSVYNISLESFVSRIKRHQILNQEIFSILNRYLKSSENAEQQIQEQSAIELFHPPDDIRFS